jgi:hypothetical protein
MDQLKPLIGTWACSGGVFETSLGPTHPTSGTLAFNPELDGIWVGFTSER